MTEAICTVKEAIREELDELNEAMIHTLQSQERLDQSTMSGSTGEIIRPKELAEMLSLSISTIYKMQGDSMLPPKINISSHAVGWLRSDIEEWLINRKTIINRPFLRKSFTTFVIAVKHFISLD